MPERFVVLGAAWFEIVVGAIFLIAPSVPCVLLFGDAPQGVAMLFARWAGIALIALGITFRPSTTPGSRAKLRSSCLVRWGGFSVHMGRGGRYSPRASALARRHPARHYRGRLVVAICEY